MRITKKLLMDYSIFNPYYYYVKLSNNTKRGQLKGRNKIIPFHLFKLLLIIACGYY